MTHRVQCSRVCHQYAQIKNNIVCLFVCLFVCFFVGMGTLSRHSYNCYHNVQRKCRIVANVFVTNLASVIKIVNVAIRR